MNEKSARLNLIGQKIEFNLNLVKYSAGINRLRFPHIFDNINFTLQPGPTVIRRVFEYFAVFLGKFTLMLLLGGSHYFLKLPANCKTG